MVAGWDSLLPAWFTRLHPRYKTPVNSILFVGIVTLVFAIASQIGVGAQEAFQLIDNAAGIFYGIAYLVLFAIPICGLRALPVRAPLWLRIAAAVGFLSAALHRAHDFPDRKRREPHRVCGKNHYRHNRREPARRADLRRRPPSPASGFRILTLTKARDRRLLPLDRSLPAAAGSPTS